MLDQKQIRGSKLERDWAGGPENIEQGEAADGLITQETERH